MRGLPLRASILATALAAVTATAPVATSLLPTPEHAGVRSAPERRGPAAAGSPASRGPAGRSARPAPIRERVTDRPEPSLLVEVPHDLLVRAWPTADARVVGTVPDGSRFYGVPMTAWIEDVSTNGRWGQVSIPYVFPRRDGWIRLGGLDRRSTFVSVQVDLSERRVTVERRGAVVFGARAAVGAPTSPTPPGRYFVSDRIPFPQGGSLGTFAFGISGIQPNLPAGWTGGDQLAIHGTNEPWSIGRAASAGCVRVGEPVLDRLKPLLRLGTPVIIHP